MEGLGEAVKVAYAIQDWLKENQIKAIFIQPGAPWESSHIESFRQAARRVLEPGDFWQAFRGKDFH